MESSSTYLTPSRAANRRAKVVFPEPLIPITTKRMAGLIVFWRSAPKRRVRFTQTPLGALPSWRPGWLKAVPWICKHRRRKFTMSTGPRKVFISYSHRQGDWVWDRLVPVLKAGGAEVLIDHERFTAGRALVGQMDATQDAANVHVLVLSPDYLASGPCVHEMERAIARDPRFEKGIVVPVKRVDVTLPDSIRSPNPLYADLTADTAIPPWDLLLGACGVDLGTDAPSWLEARDETRRFLLRGQSVNLVVNGDVEWRGLLSDLQRGDLSDLVQVDLAKGVTASRRGLISEILRSFGMTVPVPAEPEDLGELDRFLAARKRSRLALTHFDLTASRPAYGVDLFAALRYLVMDIRKLVLLVQSRSPFAALLPAGHPLSEITGIQTVELRGRQ